MFKERESGQKGQKKRNDGKKGKLGTKRKKWIWKENGSRHEKENDIYQNKKVTAARNHAILQKETQLRF